MADKFRRVEPVNITFSPGEQPTAPKLRAMGTQSRNGAQLLERAIGDLWNQSGDTIMTAYPLQINSLARTIGQTRFLNPPLYRTTQNFTYRDSIGSLNIGRTDGYTQLKPSGLPTIVGGSTAISTVVVSEAGVLVPGDIYIDQTTGRWRSYTPLTANDKIDYVVDSSQWSTGYETVPSIIPDPRQTTYTSCRVSTSSGKYYLHLPPRRPLNLSGFDRPDRYPALIDYTANEATSTSLPRKLWQAAATDALADEHYRYPLPKEMRDVINSLSVGDSLPQGFLYIYDQIAQTVLEDVIFKKSANPWVLEIASGSIDFAPKVSASEAAVNYNSTGYSLMTTGTSVARAIQAVQKAVYGTSSLFSSVRDHSSLRGLNPVSTGVNFPADGVIPTPSRWGAGDEHTSLLSRMGSKGTASTKHRDTNDNAMLGDLVLASDTIFANNYLNTSNNSRKLYFNQHGHIGFFGYKAIANTIQTMGNLNVGVLISGLNNLWTMNQDPTDTGFAQTTMTANFGIIDPLGNGFFVGSQTVNVVSNSYGAGFSSAAAPEWAGYKGIVLCNGNTWEWDLGNGYPQTEMFPDPYLPDGVDPFPVADATKEYLTYNFLSGYTSAPNVLRNTDFYGTVNINGELTTEAIETPSITLTPGNLPSQDAGKLAVGSDGYLRVGNGGDYVRVGGKLYSTSANSTLITNTSAETIFSNGLYTIPANTITAGTGFKFKVVTSIVAVTGTTYFGVKLRYGGILGATIVMSGSGPTVSVGDVCILEGTIIWDQVGSAGSPKINGLGYYGPNPTIILLTSAASMKVLYTSPLPSPLANWRTDQNKDLIVTGQWQNTSASNQARLEVFTVEAF